VSPKRTPGAPGGSGTPPQTDTAALLKKVRRIELKTRGLSADLFAGEYHSAFKGRGMSFSEVREYHFGDDIRFIDWNVTARFHTPYVKIFEEERELTVMLLLDLSPSTFFGTTGQFKHQLMAEMCAVLAFAAANNNDKVGAILFTDRVERFVPPKKGRPHILRILREILAFQPGRGPGEGAGTDIAEALRYLNGVTKKRAITFLFSDFQAEGYDTALRVAARRHDLVGVHVHDRRERELPAVGLLRVRDPESGGERWLDTGSKAIRRAWTERYDRRAEAFTRVFRQAGADAMAVDASIPEEKFRERAYIQALHRFFRRREGGARRGAKALGTLLAFALALGAALAPAGGLRAQAPPGPAAVEARLDTTHYRPGQPIRLTVDARSGEGEPLWPDLTRPPVAGLELWSVDSGEGRRTWTFQQFDTGRFMMPALPVRFPRGGDTLTLATAPLGFAVYDVPLDTAAALQPIAPIREVRYKPVPWLLIGLFALVLTLLGVWGLYRYLTRRVPEPEEPAGRPAPVKPIAEHALDRLRELEQRALWRSEPVAWWVELSDIAREYAEIRFDEPVLESTTAEALVLLAERGVTGRKVEPLRRVLELADAVKFARFQPAPDEHERGARDVAAFIEATRPVPAEGAADPAAEAPADATTNTDRSKTTGVS
jgi:uncharacterized protein (DUF58 family)